ncbi:MAG: hypothetical protein ABSE73_07880 [Planctomycetota bacterium]
MSRQGLRDIKTFGNITDRRRARTPHGAYLELASLALHKHRLLKERQFAESRDAAIEAQIGEMDRKATVLRSFVEDPQAFTLPAPGHPGTHTNPAAEPAASIPSGTAVREQEFGY